MPSPDTFRPLPDTTVVGLYDFEAGEAQEAEMVRRFDAYKDIIKGRDPEISDGRADKETLILLAVGLETDLAILEDRRTS